jgi:hypothetical protein
VVVTVDSTTPATDASTSTAAGGKDVWLQAGPSLAQTASYAGKLAGSTVLQPDVHFVSDTPHVFRFYLQPPAVSDQTVTLSSGNYPFGVPHARLIVTEG